MPPETRQGPTGRCPRALLTWPLLDPGFRATALPGGHGLGTVALRVRGLEPSWSQIRAGGVADYC